MTRSPAFRSTLFLVLVVVAAASVPPTSAEPGSADTFATNATNLDEATGRFTDRTISTHRGDVVEIGVRNAKNHRVVVGSDDSGFEVSFRVTSGGATVRLNTYKVGHSGYPVEEVVWTESGSIAEVRVEPARTNAPLEADRYPMDISFNGTESDVGSFVVTERSTNHSAGWAVPEGFEIDEDTTADSVATAGQNRTNNLSIAHGDWLALEVNASGIYGIVEKGGLDGDDGIHVEFEQTNPRPNADPNAFTGDRAAHLFTDPGDGRLFLLVDTRRHGIEPGHVYDAMFRITPESGLVEREENLTTTFEVLERESRVFYRGRKLVANASGKTTVAGNATMVAGTTFEVRARSTGEHPFLERRAVTLDENGSFETTFDLSAYPTGTNFTISIPETGLSVPAVVGEVETETPTRTPTPTATTRALTTAPPTSTPELSYTTNTPLAARTVTEGDGQPGFGFVGPAAVLLGVALLARRRWRP